MATGAFLTGTCGCTPRTTSLGITNVPILCGGVPISPTGFDSSEEYFIGDFPFDGTFMFVGWKLLLYCGGGAVRWAALDGSNCVQQEGTVAWDCEAMTGTATDMNLMGCCMDDIYTAEITFG